MGPRHPLSQKQVEELRKSPHVRFVNANILSFTGEFKEHVYNERQRGVPFREILCKAGIDPDLMGPRRIRNLSSSINEQGRRGVGFSDIVQKNPLPEDKRAAKTIEEKVARLQHELAFVKQEVEYLKKIYLADREAQQGCDSKHRRKSNSKSSGT
jgi:hypothetical protein